MSKFWRTHSGIGLIEVLVAMAILGALLLGVMRVTDQISKAESRMLDLLDIQDLMTRIRYQMGDSLACSNTFRVHYKSMMLPQSGKLISLLDKYGNDIIGIGSQYGRIEVEDISFRFEEGQFSELGEFPKIHLMQVYIKFHGVGQKSYSKQQALLVPIMGAYNGVEKRIFFDYCDSVSTPFAEQIVDQTMRRFCESLEVTYNPKKGTCDMTNLFTSGGGALPAGMDINQLIKDVIKQQKK